MPRIPGLVAAYGKLPLSPEYLKVRCFDEPWAAFRRWIDEGFNWALVHGAHTGFTFDKAVRLLWHGAPQTTAVASVRPSSDGSRAFPFATFAMLDPQNLPDDGAAAVGRLADCWHDLESAAAAAAQASVTRDVQHCIERAGPIDLGTACEPSHASLRRSLQRVGDMDALASMLWRLRQAVASLRAGAITLDSMPALRLPLGADDDMIGQTMTWLRWLDAAGLRVNGRRMTLVIPAHTVPGVARAAWLLLRTCTTRDLLVLGAHSPGPFFPEGPAKLFESTQGYRSFHDMVMTYFADETPPVPFRLLD